MEPEKLGEFHLIHSKIKLARKQILDLLQATYGHEPSWRNVRSRLLKILGRDGLEQSFLQAEDTETRNTGFDNEFSKNKN